MNLLEELKKSELWAVLVPLIVSAGLFGLTDSDTPDLVKAIPAFFSSIAMIVLAVQKQHGDNKAKVEMARSIGPGPTREISQLEQRNLPIEISVAEQLTRVDMALREVMGRMEAMERAARERTRTPGALG